MRFSTRRASGCFLGVYQGWWEKSTFRRDVEGAFSRPSDLTMGDKRGLHTWTCRWISPDLPNLQVLTHLRIQSQLCRSVHLRLTKIST